MTIARLLGLSIASALTTLSLPGFLDMGGGGGGGVGTYGGGGIKSL